ncbi:MAG: hypothetical protein WBA16_09180 [Nonlabens sp.]
MNNTTFNTLKKIIASDVEQDSFGVQFFNQNRLVLEILRMDGVRQKRVFLYCEDIDLELLKECITFFELEIPGDYS